MHYKGIRYDDSEIENIEEMWGFKNLLDVSRGRCVLYSEQHRYSVIMVVTLDIKTLFPERTMIESITNIKLKGIRLSTKTHPDTKALQVAKKF